jgi:hypothetical protein
MNRRDRRKMAHKLGILQYQQKLPFNKKFELIRENIIAGKKREIEVTVEVQRRQNLSQDERESEDIEFLAKEIAQSEKIPLIDALEKAQKQYYRGKRKKSA